MRIALIVHDYHRHGGHSRYVTELAERFSRQDEVHVFANTFPPQAALFPQTALAGHQLYLHPVPAQRAFALGTVLSFFLPASLALLRHGPFDVIHAQGFVCLQPALLTAHICCAAWHAQRLASGHGLSWKERLFDAVVMRLEAWLYRRLPARPLIAISERVATDLREHYRCRSPIRVIPHGVDAGEFDLSRRQAWRREIRQQLCIPEDRFVSLWVGDLRKGALTAIAAVAENPGHLLLLVSRNDPAPFQAQCRDLGAAERIRFLPPTHEIAKFYAAADVFLFPTTYDAFGMVVLEAMCMGLPPVVSRSAGAAELIEDGTNGFLLASPFDAPAAASLLRRLAADPERLARAARAAADTAQQQNWDRVAAATYAVYQQWRAYP